MADLLNMTARLLLLAFLGVLAGCGGEQPGDSPAQTWQDIEVRVETRPNPPHPGMTEFLILLTGKTGRPGDDYMVSVRTSDGDPWKWAVQDGRMGIYRRAAELAPGARSVLQVQLKHKGQESVLLFPFKLSS
ncbi:MAG: hypothetical protein V4443_03750 [Pseudomonadota bacterium]